MFRAYGSDADMQIFSRCGCGEVAITGTCEPFSCGQQAAAHAQQRQKAQLQTDVARAEANFNEGLAAGKGRGSRPADLLETTSLVVGALPFDRAIEV